MERIIQRHSEIIAVQVLMASVSAGLVPVSAADIKAAEMLFTDPDYRDELEALPIGGRRGWYYLGSRDPGGQVSAALPGMPLWKALGSV